MALPDMDRRARAFWWLLVLLPIAAHSVLLYRYSINAPRLDDFSDGFGFLGSFYGTDDWIERFQLLFTLYQNHRWGLLHIVYALFHCIDFRLAGFLSMPWLLLLLALWYRCCRASPFALPLLAIASLLVFNLHAWTGMFWITASLAAFPSIPLALLAFMLLARKDGTGVLIAMLLAIVATFTNGNGTLIWPLGMMYLAWQCWHQKQLSQLVLLLAWAVTASAALYAYFAPDVLPVAAEQVDRVGQLGRALSDDPILFVQGALATAGSHLLYFNKVEQWRVWLAVAIGLVEVLAMIWLLWCGALRDKPALILLLLFIAGTLAAIAATRVMFIGMGQAFQGHYKLYNSVLLLLLATAVLDIGLHRVSVRALTIGLTAIAALLYLTAALMFLPDSHQYHRELADDIRQWLYTNTLQRPESRYLVRNPNRKLAAAVDGGFYDPWTLVESRHEPTAVTPLAACNAAGDALPAVTRSEKNSRAIFLQLTSSEHPAGLMLCSQRQALGIRIDPRSYRTNENGTYSLELWVPRSIPENRDNADPWQVYPLP